jgi:glycosyltransferase involved in cell wall biosynthesis
VTAGVSVVIPTLNSAKYLDECLAAIVAQNYPREAVELIVVDAGSVDATLDIARRHGVDRVLENPLRTGEAGKAVGIRAATRELVCMVDSDNVIVGREWMARMVAPFSDPEVISSEALRWDYRREDHFINRYQALTGINDPLALFVGNYDRFSELTGRWTDYPHHSEQRDGWLKVTLDPAFVPTMGANGYVVRRTAFETVPVEDYLFDIDFVYDLVQAGHRKVARVDVAVRHYFCDSVARFYRKTRRRTDDFFFFAGEGRRTYPWTSRQRAGVARFIASTVLVLPLLWQVARGMRRHPDPAWLFHVPACWITLAVYAVGTVRGRVAPRALDRAAWSQ